jgi:hypothetical protein
MMTSPVSRYVATGQGDGLPRVSRQAADLRQRWWGGRDSNPRPKDYESFALTG